ncbi:MAG: DUF4350 domain-containing protein [Pseudoclavibacter sp.]
MTGPAPAAPARERTAGRSSTARERDAAELRDAAESLTPTFMQRLKSGRLWVLIGLIALLVTAATIVIQGLGSGDDAGLLDPASPRPEGGKAIVEVMGAHGVDVRLASSLDEIAGLEPGANTTIVLQERGISLDDAQLQRLRDLGVAKIVLVTPGPRVLEGLGSQILPGGVVEGDDSAAIAAGGACDDPIATNAPEITSLGGSAYTAPDAPGLSTCYDVGDRGLVAIDTTGDTEIVAIGAAWNLTNEWVAYEGNAAMGIGLMADTEQLIWYTPGSGDIAAGDVPALDSLVPAWLTPAIILAFITGIGVMVWRGRRYGPLVAERLPVVVPASETMEGRARLYGRTGSRLRALDNLRIGTIGRLAKALALPQTTPAFEVAVAVAQTVRWPREQVLSILVEASPGSDGELVELSDHLLRLERACLAELAVPTEPTASGTASAPGTADAPTASGGPPAGNQPHQHHHEGDA